MIRRKTLQQGFTAVELLVTLFVAGAFLIAGYQLFSIVIKDGGDARAQSRVANVAYQYMRQYSDSATNPCTTVSPMANQTITIDGLTNVRATVNISCAQPDTATLSKVQVIISYGNPAQTLTYATYVDKSRGASTDTEITNGLVGWWKLNGNGVRSGGPYDASMVATTAVRNKQGADNMATRFNGTTSGAYVPNSSSFTPPVLSVSLWVNPVSYTTPTASMFINMRSSVSNGFTVGYIISSSGLFIDCGGNGQRWIPGYAPPLNTWTHLVIVCNTSSVTMYTNSGLSANGGATYSRASNDMSNIKTPSRLAFGVESAEAGSFKLNGSLDDIRFYNRALSASEAQQLYTRGAQ